MRAALATAMVWIALCVPGGAADRDRAEALLRLVGFDVAAASIEAAFQVDEGDLAPSLGPDMAADWAAIAADLFRAETLFKAAIAQTSSALDDGQLAALEDFFSTPLGQRVTAMEVAAQDPARRAENEAAKTAYLDGLDDRFAERFALLTELSDALHAVDGAVAVRMNFMFAMMTGLAVSDTPGAALSEADILERLAALEPQFRAEAQSDYLESMAYTYRALSDEDLGAYVAFLSGAPAQALYDAVGLSMEAVLVRDARSLGEALAARAGERL